MSYDRSFYTVKDATYAYEVSGEGIPIVLLHGFTGSSLAWSAFISEFQSDFKLITIDLPGHGATITAEGKTMEACCADLAGLFEHLELSSFHLVGYSLGGRTALSFALKYPLMIASLILESASPGIAKKVERLERVKSDEALAKRIEQEGISNFVDFWESIPLFSSQRNLPTAIKNKVREERVSQQVAGLAGSLRLMGTGIQRSLWKELAGFTKPVLLIVGAFDEKFVKMNKEMQQYFGQATIEVVPMAGHTVHLEQAALFSKLVIGFISQHIKD